MLSKGKLIGLALAVALMPQLARCQAAGDGTTNVNKAASAPAVAVSVGPFVATNTCLIATASDANALKCELAAEVNKAKTELADAVIKAKDDLATQRRQDVDAIKVISRNTQDDAIAKVESHAKQHIAVLKSDVAKWYDELKDVMDTRLNVFTWVIGILVGIFGVIVPLLIEHGRRNEFKELKAEFVEAEKRMDNTRSKCLTQLAAIEKTRAEFIVLQGKLEQSQKDLKQRVGRLSGEEIARKKAFDALKESMDQQKADSEKLIDELKDQQKSQAEQFAKAKGELEEELIICKQYIAFSYAEQHWNCYGIGNNVDHARIVVVNFANAVLWSVKGCRVGDLSKAIDWLYGVDRKLTSDGNKSKVQDLLKNKNWHWMVSPDEVKKVLDVAKPEEIVGNGTSATFERIYKEYGLPKV